MNKKKRIRIIPSILIDNKRMIKGKNFQNHKYLGDIFNAVRIYSNKKSHELIILDKSAREQSRLFDTNLLKKISSEIFMPITVGGNIKSVEDAKKLINSGAEKIYLNSTIIDNYNLISDISNEIGSQSIVVGVDVKLIGGDYKIFFDNGKKFYDKKLLQHLNLIVSSGAGEIILNSISNEGTKNGFDIDLYKQVENEFDIPIIASGGASSFESFIELFDNTKLSAAAASSIFSLFGLNEAVLISYFSEKQLDELVNKYE